MGAGLLLLCVGFPVSGQHLINPRFSHYTINDGLSQGLISGITQDAQGFMWFGTKDGLNRFDGYSFKTYKHDPFDSLSLSGNSIAVLFTDSRGRLWIGTLNGGLDLYDRLHDNFIHVLLNPENPDHTARYSVGTITEDKKGRLWVGTAGNGLFELQFPEENPDSLPAVVTHYMHQPGDGNSLASNYLSNVFVDHKGRLWISSLFSPIQYADPQEKKTLFHFTDYTFRKADREAIPGGFRFDTMDCSKMASAVGLTFYEDSLHRLWMGGVDGLFLFDHSQKTATYFELKSEDLKQGTIASISSVPAHDSKSGPMLWLGTFNGIGVFDTKRLTLQMLKHNPLDPESIQKGWIIKIFRDRSGCMWAGSNGYGLGKFASRSNLFPIPAFYNADHTVSSKSFSVRSFLDIQNHLLIGTIDGLWIADKATRLMYKANLGGMPYPLIIYNMVADSNAVWIACNIGLMRYSLLENKSRFFSPGILEHKDPANSIYKLYKDGRGDLWCLTGFSLSKFNIAKQRFTHYFYTSKSKDGFKEPSYGDIDQDLKGNFWIGTSEGLFYFDTLRGTFHRYTTNPSDDSSLSYNIVRCILPDPEQPEQYLWIGTAGGGLNRLNLHTKRFIHFTERNGLPNDVVYGILPDKEGNLWMSTNKGISKFNPGTHQFHNYDVSAGLQSNEFNSGAFYENKQGKLFFGGVNGFNAFYPEDIISNPHAPEVVFTDFRLFNHSVSIKEEHSPLRYPISETAQITLPYKNNVISFQVAGLDYSNPATYQYAYKLTPSNTDWILMGSNRLITFSNLAPGHYILHVKAANSDGIWSKLPASLSLTILPPWWKTWWAYLIYLLIFAVLYYYFRRYELKRIELNNRLRMEHLEAQKLKELDHLKSRFFANISHEFRTPLTLIMGPMEDLLNGAYSKHLKSTVSEMHRHSKRLLQLINQLLDLSKLEAGSYHVNTSREDVIPFVKQVTYSFSSLAQKKNIVLELDLDAVLQSRLQNGNIHCYFDDDILEKILSNLLSNAFKYTSSTGRGKIRVSLGLQEARKDMLELKVQDNGTGISAERLPYIFDRFYQAAGKDRSKYGGSGIGLALIKELVELHQGAIEVNSEEGRGATFSCYLPLNRKIITQAHKQAQKKEGGAGDGVMMVEEAPDMTEEENTPGDNSIPIVLIVEDQRDIRNYIRKKLQGHFEVLEAENGREGWAIGLEKIPDLVISDIMMPVRPGHPGGPEMDGFELCRKLKTNKLTCHIPVILLTARAEDTDKLTGLETGADAYMIKPFNSRELLIRSRNLIAVRNKMRAAFSKKLFVKPGEITVTPLDKEFMENVLSAVENHMGDAHFSVEDLGKEVHMSASQINRKLKALIGQTTRQFINSVRMQRAMDILKKDQATILDVSWQVGFNDPSYFTRVFKKYFGCLPSEKDKFPE